MLAKKTNKIPSQEERRHLYWDFQTSYLDDMRNNFSESTGLIIVVPSRILANQGQISREIVSKEKFGQYKDIEIQSQLIFLTDRVGLNISQLADLFKVGRPSIYTWIDGSKIPRKKHINRIDIIYSIFENWGHGSKIKLSNYLYKNIFENESLYNLLSMDEPNIEKAKQFANKIKNILEEARVRAEQRKEKLEKAGFLPISKEHKRKVLDNLIRKA